MIILQGGAILDTRDQLNKENYVGLRVDPDLAAKMLECAEGRGLHDSERSRNPIGDLEDYIIQLVSDDIGEKL